MSGGCLLCLDFTRSDLPLMRVMVGDSLRRVGVAEPVRGTFIQAALEIACNAVVHGGGSGHLELRAGDGEVRCQVTDCGAGLPDDVLSQGPTEGNHGLRLAEALTGRLELRRGPEGRGTIAILAVRLEPAAR